MKLSIKTAVPAEERCGNLMIQVNVFLSGRQH